MWRSDSGQTSWGAGQQESLDRVWDKGASKVSQRVRQHGKLLCIQTLQLQYSTCHEPALFDANHVCSGVELLCVLHLTIQCRKVTTVFISIDIHSKVRACMAVMGIAADGLLTQCAYANPF